MSKREALLLRILLFFGVIALGAGFTVLGYRSWRSGEKETQALRDRVLKLKSKLLEQQAWSSSSGWAQENAPVFDSTEAASSRLLDLVSTYAETKKLSLSGKEIINSKSSGMEQEATGFFQKCSVKVKLDAVSEETLFSWLHMLSYSDHFVGITDFEMSSQGTAKTVDCTVILTLFYK
jgi:hypothetical protein